MSNDVAGPDGSVLSEGLGPPVESTTEPTPGPWVLYRSERHAEWYVNQDGGPGYICTMPWFEHRQAQCAANAKLVAAAPSLAQRLAELVTRYSMDGVPNDSAPSVDAALQLLRELGHPLPTWLRAERDLGRKSGA